MKDRRYKYISESKTRWHDLLGDLLEKLLVPLGISVFTDVSVMSKSPEADILLLRKETSAWTPEQRERLADGIRDTKARHILIEFKYTESASKHALRQSIGYDHFYKKARHLPEKEVQTFLVSSRSPDKKFLLQCGYAATVHKGVFQTEHPVIKTVQILSLNDLSNDIHNAYLKCFASRTHQKYSAFDILKGRGMFFFADGQIQRVLTGLLYWFGMKQHDMEGGDDMIPEIILTPELISETGKKWIEAIRAGMSVEERLAGLKPEDVLSRFKPEDILSRFKPEDILSRFKPEERLSGLKTEEIEAYLRKIKRKGR